MSDGDLTLADGAGMTVRICSADERPVQVHSGWYCPEFNRRSACCKLEIAFEAELPARTGWEIELL